MICRVKYGTEDHQDLPHCCIGNDPGAKETPALSGERRPGDAISGGADLIVPESCTFVKRYF
jgi:hypothetical protein